MLRPIVFVALAFGFAAASLPTDADAGKRRAYRSADGYYAYRKGPRVKGYVARRGGYSYDYSDSINTYGDSRGRFGTANSLRFYMLGRQTEAGPFDHGFFFDSATQPRGGDAPYMH